ncbi:hypothetical protein ACFB49_45310 [Sphingomonas sp. DBB INV C78]
MSRAGDLASQVPGMVRAMTRRRPTLLSLTAGVAAISAVANAVAATTPPADQQPATRLGTSIQQSVRERDQALAQQKRVLELREQAARATEARLKADLEARQAQAAPAGSAAAGGKAAVAADEPYDELARIYQTMKPAKAAVIFERLDLDVQTEIAKRMRERSTALIVSNMKPDAAVQLSMALAGRGAKPRPAVEAR